MKQAILITCYKNLHQIIEIIRFFDENFTFYIHIDKKSNLDLSSLFTLGRSVHIYSEYAINWGGHNHVKAILHLAEQALSDKENNYFHFISGEDFPIKPLSYFKERCDLSKDHLDFEKIPRHNWEGNGGRDRVDYYNLYDKYNAKNLSGNLKIQQLKNYQIKLNRKRPYPACLPQLYGGSSWWSLTRETLAYVIEYSYQQPQFLKRMEYTFASDEIYFQTIIMNSPYATNVVNDNLRYIDWQSCRGGNPAFLDSSDFSDAILSNKLFTRKFHYSTVLMLNLLLNKIEGYYIV